MIDKAQMAKLARLRGELEAEETLQDALAKIVEECKRNPVEPTPVRVVKARAATPQARGRGWRRARRLGL